MYTVIVPLTSVKNDQCNGFYESRINVALTNGMYLSAVSGRKGKEIVNANVKFAVLK